MRYKENENNHAVLCGTVCGEFSFDHEVYGEKFYRTTIEASRTSGVSDFVPVMVSSRIVDMGKNWDGRRVLVRGSFRSYNKHEKEKSYLILHLFAQDFMECGNDEPDVNDISVYGILCKPAIYRRTPLGREVADVMLAVNRPYGKSSYIPCVLWGRNARFSVELNVGDYIRLHGRIQSREYRKQISDGEYIQRTAYELSANSLEVVSDVEKSES